MTSDASPTTPSSATSPRFQPLDEDTLRRIFEGLLVPGRGSPAIGRDTNTSGKSVKKYRDRWIEDGLLLELAGGGYAVNPERPNPFGVTGPPVDPALLVPADGDDAGAPGAGGADTDGTETREPLQEPAAAADGGGAATGTEPAAAATEPATGRESGVGAAPEPAERGDDTENGGAAGAPATAPATGGRGAGTAVQDWRLPPEGPTGPVAVDGAVPPPAATGLVDPTVIEVQLQMPVTLIAAWNLMRLDGLALSFNDWAVQTLELHYANCVGVLVALVTTAVPEDGAPASPTPAP